MLATKKSAWLVASSLFMGCVFLPNTVNASLKLAPLGEVPIPADNKQTPEKIELGKILFFDGRLSGDTTSPCSGCHIQSQGWGFPDDLSMGYPGTVHWRNSQTIINSAYYNKLFWAGSAMSLEAQAKDAAKGAVAGNGEDDIMEARLALVPEYVERFKQVFGDDTPKIHNAWRAISAFERTMVQRDTPIDNYLLGDETALSESQLKGKALFEGKANCIACHNGSLASDQKFYNIGVPPSPWWNDDGLAQITFRFELYSKGVTEEMYRTLKADPGAYFRAKRKEMLGKFRTPSLRYTKYTAPYMHNGTIPTLEAVIDFYDRGGVADDGRTTGFPQTKSVLIQPLGLTEQDKKNLLSFVEAFSGEQISIDEPKIPEYQPLFTKEELAGVKK
ncbi:cytochrome-c peroxidase [Vibrio splendidus]|uniref:Cytochrome-c peroxidase n=1 Tax=Vibrio splendidus TaxID=29497 RepID=A0A2N7JSF4_VIBSP|nr:cytochrome c peroxidase [Vibrio splendidus]OED66017.1 cytochrome-c peroxidase [Vibrio splendidus ZS-139]PMM57785.1 cytochrome-c peroxidase [Vibrio splendidus]